MDALILKLHYLTGRSVATTYNDRERAEWPPHPARLYSALVAAWAESERPDQSEREALEWLATLAAPSIYASAASHRAVVPHFVPVNDVSVLKSFDAQAERLAELRRIHEDNQAEYERAQRAGDGKAQARAAKALAKSESALGAGRKKLDQQLLEDQKPYTQGTHPKTKLDDASALVPEQRGKQPRTFPSVSLEDPRVFMRWSAPAEEVQRHRAALASLVSRVVRVGHSASLVTAAVVDDCPSPTWEPSETGDQVLRVPGAGQLTRLEEAFARHQEVEPRVLPCRFQRYERAEFTRRGAASGHSGFSDDWIVFQHVRGRRLSQTALVELARALRGGLMKHAEDPPPELLSGHQASGAPSERPHVAIVGLPFVGHPHATGELLGVALVFPRDADEAQRRAVLRAIHHWEAARRNQHGDEESDVPPLELKLGRAGAIEVERSEWGAPPLKTLRPATWCRPSRAWVTATPVALDRNPGDLRSSDPAKAEAAYEAAQVSISMACQRIGLPAPSYVQVHPSVPLNGAVKARAYPAFPSNPNKHQRVKVHARLEFPVPVAGPILLGAGRYYGLGLCFPQPAEARFKDGSATQ